MSPHLRVLVIGPVYHGFCLSRFSVSPKIRDKQGLPVNINWLVHATNQIALFGIKRDI